MKITIRFKDGTCKIIEGAFVIRKQLDVDFMSYVYAISYTEYDNSDSRELVFKYYTVAVKYVDSLNIE